MKPNSNIICYEGRKTIVISTLYSKQTNKVIIKNSSNSRCHNKSFKCLKVK